MGVPLPRARPAGRACAGRRPRSRARAHATGRPRGEAFRVPPPTRPNGGQALAIRLQEPHYPICGFESEAPAARRRPGPSEPVTRSSPSRISGTPESPPCSDSGGRAGGVTEGRAPITLGPSVRRRPTPTQAHRHRPVGAEGMPFSLREDRWRGTPAVSWYVVGHDVYPALGPVSCTPWPKSRAALWPPADEVEQSVQRRNERSGAHSTRAERPPSPGPLSGGDATPHRNTKRDPDRGTANDTPSTPGGRLRGQSHDGVVLRRRTCGYTSSTGVTQVTKLKIL